MRCWRIACDCGVVVYEGLAMPGEFQMSITGRLLALKDVS